MHICGDRQQYRNHSTSVNILSFPLFSSFQYLKWPFTTSPRPFSHLFACSSYTFNVLVQFSLRYLPLLSHLLSCSLPLTSPYFPSSVLPSFISPPLSSPSCPSPLHFPLTFSFCSFCLPLPHAPSPLHLPEPIHPLPAQSITLHIAP